MMDTTGAVCPWGDHPQRDLPRHPAMIPALRKVAEAVAKDAKEGVCK